ncbi:MAG TPA: hypothetical protein VLE89_07690 [Chlamydiales bacterium]|nr:hypothetical protein [Chlamydiales bacterium]
MKEISLFLILAVGAYANQVFLEGKAAYFWPQDHRFREIYGAGGLYGLEMTIQGKGNIYVWLSADYFTKNGSSVGGNYGTKIDMVPLAIGLKCNFLSIRKGEFFLGLGATGTYVHIHDFSPYVIQKTSKWGAGGIAKLNLLLRLPRSCYIDLFTNYFYNQMEFDNTEHGKVPRRDVNFGGFIFGAALCFPFGKNI